MWGIDDFSAISWSANNPSYPLLGFAPWLTLPPLRFIPKDCGRRDRKVLLPRIASNPLLARLT